MGLGAQGAQGGGRLPAVTWVLPAQTQAGFSAGFSQDHRLAAVLAEAAALGSPGEKQGQRKDVGRKQGFGGRGAGGWPEGELEDVCASRAPQETVSTE